MTPAPYDLTAVRADFPILARPIRGKPLVYLDNGASAQRPSVVIDAERRYAQETHANVHRGVHTLSQRATDAFEGARERVRRFLNARTTREIVFTRGTTESINLVAQAYARPKLGPGDEILITHLEHHANIVPWQLVCSATGARLVVVPINERGEVGLDDVRARLNTRTRLVAIAHVSNALGTVLPVAGIIELAHAVGVPVLVDGAQAIPHMRVDVQALDADFYAFSGHKLYGPDGIGVLYGRQSLLEAMPPWQGGGDMILHVSFDGTTYNELPYKFEAGTPHMSGAVGLAAAIDYVEDLGLDRIGAWEAALLAHAHERLGAVDGLRVIGTAQHKAGLVSFVVEGVHPHDLGTILDEDGIAIRTGHHCAMPAIEHFKVPATARASFGLYTTREEIDCLAAAVVRARDLLR